MMVTRIDELGTTLAATSNWRTLRRTTFFIVTAARTSNLMIHHYCEMCASLSKKNILLRNFGFYTSQTASYSTREHSCTTKQMFHDWWGISSCVSYIMITIVFWRILSSEILRYIALEGPKFRWNTSSQSSEHYGLTSQRRHLS
jgi:hypothetical protein